AESVAVGVGRARLGDALPLRTREVGGAVRCRLARGDALLRRGVADVVRAAVRVGHAGWPAGLARAAGLADLAVAAGHAHRLQPEALRAHVARELAVVLPLHGAVGVGQTARRAAGHAAGAATTARAGLAPRAPAPRGL